MSDDVVHFELNNWFAERDYPHAEPYISWMKDDCNLKLNDDEWAKENKLCVVSQAVDMSVNFCVTASRDWVEKNCPSILTEFSTFLRDADTDYDTENRNPNKIKGKVYGKFGTEFLDYKPENFGVHVREDPTFHDLDDYFNVCCWFRNTFNGKRRYSSHKEITLLDDLRFNSSYIDTDNLNDEIAGRIKEVFVKENEICVVIVITDIKDLYYEMRIQMQNFSTERMNLLLDVYEYALNNPRIASLKNSFNNGWFIYDKKRDGVIAFKPYFVVESREIVDDVGIIKFVVDFDEVLFVPREKVIKEVAKNHLVSVETFAEEFLVVNEVFEERDDTFEAENS